MSVDRQGLTWELMSMTGLKWEQRVKEELVQARQKAETDPPMFQEPFASSTLQMAEFDIQDPVKFLGGARDVIAKSMSMRTTSMRHAPSLRGKAADMEAMHGSKKS
eukprot:1160938-Pelagomonas_calceolata.AAC.1